VYGYATWSLTLREEHAWQVKMVLRKIFGPKCQEVMGGWRRLHNEELCNLNFSPNIIHVIKSRRIRLAGHIANMGEVRNAGNILIGKPEGKRPLGIPRHKWDDNIGMDHRERGWEVVDWIHVAQDRELWWVLVNMVMNLQVS
jgi:hypothetical protein